MDMWDCGPASRPDFTTVGNWMQSGREIEFEGELYKWSKHHEFLKFIDIPNHVSRPVELATNLGDPDNDWNGGGTTVPAFAMPEDARSMLNSYGWQIVNGTDLTTDPWSYRNYIVESSGEFTVARDLNVRLKSGWFSERSACYLAAGRPVITQDTGFGRVLPTGEGLFAFSTREENIEAFDAISADYDRQSRAARAIAEEYFRHDVVLPKLLDDLGL
jgi:hypothetical protein